MSAFYEWFTERGELQYGLTLVEGNSRVARGLSQTVLEKVRTDMFNVSAPTP